MKQPATRRQRATEGTEGTRGRSRAWFAAGLALTLVLLLAHAWRYRFLTDDAFISFRYARNLAHGHGLVFNPGHEAVEGYSNFLWVLLLAAFDALGAPPEVMAHVLSLAATVALWAIVAAFAFARLRARGRDWLALVPLGLLAATRSVAVWSTSGLETRAFEVLALAGWLRLVVEVEADLAGRPRRALAGWLLALAALTRPDGLLVAAATLGAAMLLRARRGRYDLGRLTLDALPGLALVGGHLLWRHATYGDWLPNTYYVKVDGRTWWSMGAQYAAAFALEYAAWLWVPLLVLAVGRHRRLGTAHVPLLAAAFVLPHLLYVIAIGGDHFEYRPLDLYFPIAFLLLADGLAEWTERGRAWAGWAPAWALAVLVGLWELPAESHAQFPARYLSGFPGTQLAVPEARAFMDPQRSWLYRWPGLDAIASAYRDRLRTISYHFGGLRQEEHALFLASVMPDAIGLRDAVRDGLLPREFHLGIPCIGAIPYFSDLRILDWLGLADAHIAHLPFTARHSLAHDKVGTVSYGRERGVDLWAFSPHPVLPLTSPALTEAIRTAGSGGERIWVADLGGGRYLCGYLPCGPEAARRHAPRLVFEPLDDRAVVARLIAAAAAAERDSMRRAPSRDRELQLAHLLLLNGEVPDADSLYRDLADATPEDAEVWERLAICRSRLGDPQGSDIAVGRALALAEAGADSLRLERLLRNRYHFAFDPARPLWPQLRHALEELANGRAGGASPGGAR